MYQSIYYDRNKWCIHLWDDVLGYQKLKYKKYAYVKSSTGIYKSIFGDTLSKITRINYNTDYGDTIFESDVSPTTRTLVDLYYDQNINVFPKHRTLFFDIEVEVGYGFPDPTEVENKITSIAYLYAEKEKYTILLLDESQTLDTSKLNLNYNIKSFKTEKQLLHEFVNNISKIKPTIMTGWNSSYFDIPYIINRCNKIIGIKETSKLSEIGIINKNPITNKFEIAGINLLDYLELYKKFTYNEEASYRLDLIAKKELGRGKIEYDGSLQQLYEIDKEKFIEYNITDVELVYEIDKKVKFIDLVIGISQKGKIKYEDILYSSRYLEGAILSYLKGKKLVAPNKKKMIEGTSHYTGAYVKIPKVGLHSWVYDLDLTSLYPSIIMSLNISPETKIAKIVNWNSYKFINNECDSWELYHYKYDKTIELTTKKLKQFLKDSKYNISSNGIMYINSNERIGVIPALLEEWFKERVKYKNLMKKYGKENNKNRYEFYDKLQNIQKILLNSLYGVLGLPVFRFYDKENALAVTSVGQQIIKWSEFKLNEYYNNQLNTDGDYVIYGDTDSIFTSVNPLLKKLYPNLDENDDALIIEKSKEIIKNVQTYINESYNELSNIYLNLNNKHRFEIKRELICKGGLWTAKKRYALLVVDREGINVDKLDIKGLDVVKSSFPPAFSGFLKQLLKDILRKTPKSEINNKILELENNLNSINIENISRTTSINNISKYYNNRNNSNTYYKDNIFSPIPKSTPAHVKAAIKFNDLIKFYGYEKNIPPIKNGEKIKWCYLKTNKFGIDALAFRGYDDPKEVIDIISKNVDRNKIYDRELKSKVIAIFDVLNWTYPTQSTEIANLFFN